MHVIGIDLGTSSTKTILLSDEGEVVATASAGYPLHKPKPGWVEQESADWWKALCQTVRSVLDESGVSNSDIKGVALSGQLNGAVFSDEKGNALGRVPIWLDHRSQAECDWANERAEDVIRRHACQSLSPVSTLAKVVWVYKNDLDRLNRTHHVLLPKDWLRYQLTETFAADVTDSSVTAAFDMARREWSGEILDALEIRQDIFPKAYESPEVVGTVTAGAADETGLTEGTPVCAGGGDVPCMVVGGGVVAPGIANVGIGTAGKVTTFAESVSDAAYNQLWPMCHPMPGKYAWLGCTFTGGGSMVWCREQFGGTFDELTALGAEVPAGSEGLFFMPWLEGAATPHPDAHARGGFIGLTLRHTKGHMVRALMEGVVYDLHQSLDCFENVGLPIDEIYIGEGGSRSALWRDIQANVFGRDVKVLETEDLSANGAAIIAGVGTGLFPDFETACYLTIRFGETVRFNAELHAQYDSSYRRYCELYPALKEWFGNG